MLKTLRKRKRLTQKELSELAGISQSYVSALEKNYFKYSPTVRNILALSCALDVDAEVLFKYFAKKEIEYFGNKW